MVPSLSISPLLQVYCLSNIRTICPAASASHVPVSLYKKREGLCVDLGAHKLVQGHEVSYHHYAAQRTVVEGGLDSMIMLCIAFL